jgi:hypothetical protein
MTAGYAYKRRPTEPSEACEHSAALDLIENAGGETIARQCTKCRRIVEALCLVCRRWYFDVGKHHASTDCGKFFRAGKIWRGSDPT